MTIKDSVGIANGGSQIPRSTAEARGNGAVACKPEGVVDEKIYRLQTENGPLTAAYRDIFSRASNAALTADIAEIRARRQALAKAGRQYDAEVKFNTKAQGLDWDSAVACGEFAELAYADENVVREQSAKWGFGDVQFVSKKTSIREFKDFFHARDVQAFTAASKDAIVVAFRGTERNSLHDILTDIAALWPLDMTVKALPTDLTLEQRAQFENKLLAWMKEHLGVDLTVMGADPNRRLSATQLSTIINLLPQATAEALGDASTGRVVENAIHRGFKESKDLVAPELLTKVLTLWEDDLANHRPLRPVYVCGHSMGGAEATLFGYDLLTMAEQVGALAKAAGLTNLSKLMSPNFKVPLGGVYTYEAPHSFKAKAAKEASAMRLGFDATALIHNFVRLGDPVPNVPNFGNYTSIGNTIYLDGTLGRLEGCPDPRAKALVDPSTPELKAALKERSDWFDATAPADVNAHLLGPLRDLIKGVSSAAAQRAAPQ